MAHKAPIAKKISHVHDIHGHQRIDNYHWMTERDAPEVIDYLKKENDYYDASTAHTNQLKDDLFNEIKGRIKEDDESVPYLLNGYWYISKMETGESYPYYYRRKDGSEEQELLFNVNEMAVGNEYYKLTSMNISPDNKLVAYGVDTKGRREYTIYIKNLETGEIFEDYLELTTGGSVWANDNKTLFFTRKDQQTLRADKIYKYQIGTPAASNQLIFEEKDEIFNCFVYKTMSERFIMIKSSATLSDEVRFIDADQPDSEFKLVQERLPEMEYSVSHYKDSFYIMTNKDKATNFKIMKTAIETPQMENWVDFIAHDPEVLLEDFDLFENYFVISDRFNGLNRIRIKAWDNTVDYFLPFNNETYTAFTSANFQFKTNKLRYNYNSMTTPPSVIEFDMETREEIVLKTQPIEDPNFNPDNYVSERVWATAVDGIKVPISLVYR